MMNILFLTSGHLPLDDRIFYHMGASLVRNGHSVQIISSKSDIVSKKDNINLNCFTGDDLPKKTKVNDFVRLSVTFAPDTIVCSEPLTILAAGKYRKRYKNYLRIVYDITEWYPSKKNLDPYKFPVRWFHFLVLLVFNIRAASFAGSFIFGEWYKSLLYRIIFPFKKFTYIPYYPDPDYIFPVKPSLSVNKLKLSYSGKISMDKGYGNFFKVLHKLSEMRPGLEIEVRIIGWYESEKDKNECDHLFNSGNPALSIKRYDRQEFHDFISLIKDTDIFIDLRTDDFENQHCLPIKLFYYAHMGRPVIFSNLKSVQREVEIEKFGFSIPPEDTIAVCTIILQYIDDSDLYNRHCLNARELAENKYNWKLMEHRFIDFIAG